MSVSYRPRSKQFHVGDYVVLKNREGYIRYIGEVKSIQKEYVSIRYQI